MGLAVPPISLEEVRRTKTLYRYQAAVRAHLAVNTYAEAGEHLVINTTLEAAETMSDPADLINRAIEVLHAAAIDLPAFSTLDRLVNKLRGEVHGRIYDRVAARLTVEHAAGVGGVADQAAQQRNDELQSPQTGARTRDAQNSPAVDRSARLVDRHDRSRIRFCRASPIPSSGSSRLKPRPWR